ncbi:DUF1403 family protein [Oceaniradius stylonematis]|uniref:DUF1403 family protein n=1 Tax=Oceaniradius stylonematis TaxID=2184161 RepID=UPI003204F3B1
MALAAGTAIGALDLIVRRQAPWAGAWRLRLALTAAATTAKQAGRVEDEAALRDAVLLTRPGDEVGPAGLLLMAWRRLAGRPAETLLTAGNLAVVLEEFCYAREDAAVGNLAGDLEKLAARSGTVGLLTGAVVIAEKNGFGRMVGFWLADVLLAQRLGWPHAVPLLGTQAPWRKHTPRRGLDRSPAAASVELESERAKHLLAAQARAALAAIDLFAELERRAERLIAIAPKLRARASDLVVEKLLCDDAIIASERIAGMSDRGLRRLFDRLVELEAVRELSGRPTFRIYGL